jgi:predicted dienelactone hydrolase
MRFLEILTPVLLGIHLLWRYPRPTPIRYLPVAALLLLGLHLILEGYRWQMIPLYILTAILTGFSLFGSDPGKLASYATFGLVALASAIPLLLPVPRIADPGGPHSVGTSIFELTDDSRKELYSGRNESRRFMIQVWYPSEAGESSERAPWMTSAKIYAPAIAEHIHMPSFFLDHLALVKIPAYKDTEVASAEKPFPIILFSHGWQGFNAQNTGQALELASHGFVVVGVQHTYGAVVTVFPDGTIAGNNPDALPDGAPDDEYEIAAQKLANQWAGDLGYALDFLKSQNEDSASPFYGALDLERVGAYGHSTGGGAAIQFCGTNSRCKALFGQDPFMRPVSSAVIDSGISQPSFFMFSQVWADETGSRNNALFRKFYPSNINPLGAVSIQGTAHYDFTDLPLLSPLAPQLGLKGPIQGTRVTKIVNDCLLAFFELTLTGQGSDLLADTLQKYEEIRTIQLESP